MISTSKSDLQPSTSATNTSQPVSEKEVILDIKEERGYVIHSKESLKFIVIELFQVMKAIFKCELGKSATPLIISININMDSPHINISNIMDIQEIPLSDPCISFYINNLCL